MNRRRPSEPLWRDPRHPSSRLIPAPLRDWLLDESSLTRRLQHLCPDRFGVELVSQRRERPTADEARLLGIPVHSRPLVRRVYLLCGESRWVAARTVIPESTLKGPNAPLARLGTMPLGTFLFRQPGVRRGPLQVTFGGHDWAPGSWGRRSIFYLRDRPLLVSEFFLPAFMEEALWDRG